MPYLRLASVVSSIWQANKKNVRGAFFRLSFAFATEDVSAGIKLAVVALKKKL